MAQSRIIDKNKLFPTKAGTPQGGINLSYSRKHGMDGLEAAHYKVVNTVSEKTMTAEETITKSICKVCRWTLSLQDQAKRF